MKKVEKKMLKTKLSLALSTALLGFGIMGQGQAVPALTTDGLGDAALFPYYTAQGGWQTFIRLINTSNDSVAVKVRFREQANSRDVLDFIVLMSPHDIWSAWTDPKAAKGGTVPGIRTNDTSCIAPGVNTTPLSGEGFEWENQATNLVSAAFKDRAFFGTPYDDGGTTHFAGGSTARLAEGHIEVIGIASYPDGTDMNRWITHNQGTGNPDSCTSAINALTLAKTGAGVALSEAADVGNVIGANAYLINSDTGQGAGYNPTMIKDFQTVSLVAEAVDTLGIVGPGRKPDLNSAAAGPVDPSIVRGAELVQYLALATTAGSTGNVAPAGVDVISTILMRKSINNEWAAKPKSGIFSKFTQWVVTFPTKNFYVDLDNDLNLLDDVSPTLTDPTVGDDAVAPFIHEFDLAVAATGNVAGRSCQPYAMDIYNTEEGHAGFTSPAPSYNVDLCQETNVIAFDAQFAAAGLNSANPVVVPTVAFPTAPVVNGVNTGLKATSGWAQLTFRDPAAPNGLPVDGFMFTVYNNGAATANYTTIHDHKYGQ